MTEELNQAWSERKAIHAKSLAEHGVHLPKEGTAKQIHLAVLYDAYKQDPERLVSKNEIARIVTKHMPHLATDQQVRHLKRDGWQLCTPTRGWHRLDPYTISSTFAQDTIRRATVLSTSDFEDIKEAYHFSCASCGVKEDEISWRYGEVVKLEKGHMNPETPQTIGSVIPQCQFCNKAYKSDFTFDEKGRVKAIASTDPVKRASKKVQKEVWKFLKTKFGSTS